MPWEIWMRQSVNAKKKTGTIGIFRERGDALVFFLNQGLERLPKACGHWGRSFVLDRQKSRIRSIDASIAMFYCDDSERKRGSSKKYPLGGMRGITRE